MEIGQLPSLRNLYIEDAAITGDLGFMAPMRAICKSFLQYAYVTRPRMSTNSTPTPQSNCGSMSILGWAEPFLHSFQRSALYVSCLGCHIILQAVSDFVFFSLESFSVTVSSLTGSIPTEIGLARTLSTFIPVLPAVLRRHKSYTFSYLPSFKINCGSTPIA